MAYPGSNFDSKHLKTGDPRPPSKPDTLRLYSMRYCPYAERVMLTLSLKKIPHEVVNINLKNKPEWFTSEVSPLGKVPVLEKNGKFVRESMIAAEYLDEVCPQSQMLSKDSLEKANQKFEVEVMSKLQGAYYGVVMKLKEPAGPDQAAMQNLHDALDLIASHLKGAFLGGASPSWQDYMTFPWLERLGSVKLVSPKGDIIQLDTRHPKIVEYIRHMTERPEVKAVVKPDESHAKFMKAYASGEPDYDFESK